MATRKKATRKQTTVKKKTAKAKPRKKPTGVRTYKKNFADELAENNKTLLELQKEGEQITADLLKTVKTLGATQIGIKRRPYQRMEDAVAEHTANMCYPVTKEQLEKVDAALSVLVGKSQFIVEANAPMAVTFNGEPVTHENARKMLLTILHNFSPDDQNTIIRLLLKDLFTERLTVAEVARQKNKIADVDLEGLANIMNTNLAGDTAKELTASRQSNAQLATK